MISKIQKVKLSSHLDLHLIKSDKFKTDLISVYIKRPLREFEVSQNALLMKLLRRSTKKYPTFKELAIKLEELYGLVVVSESSKMGDFNVLSMEAQVPNSKLLGNDDIFDEAVKLIFELLFNPDVKNSKFNEEYFNKEVENLISDIENLIHDKIGYTFYRILENMCSDEVYRLNEDGYIEDFKKITPESLYEHYLNIINSSHIDICVVGDIEFDKVVDSVKKNFNVDIKECVDYPVDLQKRIPKEVKQIYEKDNTSQSQLILGYRNGVRYGDKLHAASALLGDILGGGAVSRLFVNLREEQGLCYRVFSKVSNFKDIMVVMASIDAKNKDKVVELIEEEIQKIIQGDLTELEIDRIKKQRISGIDSSTDYQSTISNYFYTKLLIGQEFNIEATKQKYLSVTKEEIVEAAKLLKLDTVYFLSGEVSDEHK